VQAEKSNNKLVMELAEANRQIDSQHSINLDLATTQKKMEEELIRARQQIAGLETAIKASSKPVSKPDIRLAKVTPVPPKPIPVPAAPKPASRKPVQPEPEISAAVSKPPAPPPEKTDLPDVRGIDSFVRSWAEAWSRKDVEDYLAYYSGNFKPSKGISLAAWQKQRHQRLGKPKFIKIGIKNIQKKALGESLVQVTFNQRYQSNTYGDRVVKTLVLQWKKNGWMILKETSRAIK
jgi:adhesin transport system outer membrane protein